MELVRAQIARITIALDYSTNLQLLPEYPPVVDMNKTNFELPRVGDWLIAVDGTSLVGHESPFNYARELIQAAPRPVVLRFLDR